MSISRLRKATSTTLLSLLLMSAATTANVATGDAGGPPIQLEAKDGSVTISGDLLRSDGEVYLVRTENLGVLRIQAASFNCVSLICPESAAEIGPNFGIYGSRTVGTTLIPNLLRGYAKAIGVTFEMKPTDDPAERIVRLINPDGTERAVIDLQTRGSGSAFPALAEGVAAIGLADRRMKDSDVEKIAASGIRDLRGTDNETVLGVDGIVMITHPENPVRNLTSLDIARIWAGEITNWQELGGGDYPITINSFGEGSGDRAVMLDAMVRPHNRDETAEVTRWKDYQDMIDSVMKDRGGIGFVGRWLARTNNVNLLDIREECGLLSPPTDFRMKIEGYAMSRRLYAYTPPGQTHPEAKAFLDWALTAEAQPYIKDSHFINRDLERMKLHDMGMTLIHTAAVEEDFSSKQFISMTKQLRNADRLSISFRFGAGSSTLDRESMRNLQELANMINRGDFEGQNVMLVGFTDSIGGVTQNAALSKSRANTARKILVQSINADAIKKINLQAMSFGELLPLSCNTSDVGRARNRRVEVWIGQPDTVPTN